MLLSYEREEEGSVSEDKDNLKKNNFKILKYQPTILMNNLLTRVMVEKDLSSKRENNNDEVDMITIKK